MDEDAEGRDDMKTSIVMALLILATLGPPTAACFYMRSSYVHAEEGTLWMHMAAKAWSYFAPGVGVDEKTGISRASNNWPRVTDWDVGNYIVALVDARELGLIGDSGPWGFRDRVNRILSFLEERELAQGGVPYSWYESSTGRPWRKYRTNFWDSGMLLAALHYLEGRSPEYAARVHSIVSRVNYKSLLISHPSGPYGYLCSWGFRSFGIGKYDPEIMLKDMISCEGCPRIYGVQVPRVLIGDPVALSVIVLGPTRNRIELMDIYTRAMEARYNNTGLLSAWSEGNTGLEDPSYIYEYASLNGMSWVITAPGRGMVGSIPVEFVKTAAAMHAITPSWYTRLLLEELTSKTASSHGFYEGVADDGRVVDVLIDKTNAMIVASARYALSNAGRAG